MYKPHHHHHHDHHEHHHDHHHKPEPHNHHRHGIGRLEAITVCVDYADFLEVTLQHNLHHFDEFVVVTSHEDKATQAVCERHGVICVVTDSITERGDGFNKGNAINIGLAHLRHTGWLIHLDADVVLPDRFRSMLDKSRLNEDAIYGADRINIRSREQYEKLIGTNEFKRQFHHKYLVNVPESFPIGARLLHNEYGYCPIGYFQLWHASQKKRYPYNQGSAEHTDVLFSLQWRVEKRLLLPNVIVYHLESERARMGKNWNGRQTKKF